MRIPSGTTDQVIYFIALDATDLKTRETGLSSFTVYRDRNGAGAAVMAATITEVSSSNMPGLYKLLLDDDMDIAAGNDSEEMVFHITHAGMAPVTRAIELYRPKITLGNTASVESDGDLTKVNTLDGHTAQTGDSFARLGAPAGASVSADIAALPTQADITGGAYALDTDANGRIRVVDGTGTGEIDTASGVVLARLADGVTHGGSTAALQLQNVSLSRSSSAAALTIQNSGAGPALTLQNTGGGPAIFYNSTTAPPVRINANEVGDDVVLFTVNGSTVAKIDTNGVFTGGVGSVTGGINTAAGTITTLDGLDTAQDTQHSQTQTDIGNLNDPTAGAIADAVLDEALSGHTTAGTLGKAVADIESDAAAILLDTGTDGVVVNAAGLATDAVNEIRNAITGGAYALDTDANGRIRIVDGTGAGELDTSAGLIAGIAGTKNTLDDLNDITVAGVLTTQMTEAYAANTVAPTLAQSLFAIHQKLMAHAYSGTTSSTKKLDGTTTAFSGELDDATNPTSDIRS